MSIENNLRKIVNVYKHKYFVEDTEEIFNEDVSIYTGDIIDITDIEPMNIPQKVMLSCIINAEKIDTPICVINSSLSIYKNFNSADNIAYKNVTIKYTGFGKIILENKKPQDFVDKKIENYTLECDDILYQHSFVYQSHDISYTAGSIQLMAYGGRYVYGDDITRIQQTFFHIKNLQSTPSIFVSDQSFWTQHGIDPFVGGRTLRTPALHITSVDKYPINAHYNLSEIINNGYIKIKLVGNDNTSLIFQSTSYRQERNTNKLDIIFTLSDSI